MRSSLILSSGLLALTTISSPVISETFPTKPIRIISGGQTGSSGDVAGRMLATKLTETLGQPVVFEMRPGANGAIAANLAKLSPPDGYTLLYVNSGTLVTAPFLIKNTNFDPINDFTPISLVVGAPSFLAVNSSLPVNSTRELVAYAATNPGKVTYGSTGVGSAFHMIGEALKAATGIDSVHVPYSGANTAMIISDLMTNRIQVYFPGYTTVQAALATGNVKLLSVFDTIRSKRFPDLPTVSVALPENRIIPSWFALLGPAGIPPTIVDRLHTEIRAALSERAIESRLDELGNHSSWQYSRKLASAINRGMNNVGSIVKTLGIEAN